MPVLPSIRIIRLMAVMALLGAMWQTAAGHLEHLGLISHAHVVTSDLGENTQKTTHGLMHHHHLPDLDVPVEATVRLAILRLIMVPAPVDLVVPDAPVFGIEYPPQLS